MLLYTFASTVGPIYFFVFLFLAVGSSSFRLAATGSVFSYLLGLDSCTDPSKERPHHAISIYVIGIFIDFFSFLIALFACLSLSASAITSA